MHNLKWGVGLNSVMLEMIIEDTRFPKSEWCKV